MFYYWDVWVTRRLTFLKVFGYDLSRRDKFSSYRHRRGHYLSRYKVRRSYNISSCGLCPPDLARPDPVDDHHSVPNTTSYGGQNGKNSRQHVGYRDRESWYSC